MDSVMECSFTSKSGSLSQRKKYKKTSQHGKWNYSAVMDGEKRSKYHSKLASHLYLTKMQLDTKRMLNNWDSYITCADLDQIESEFLLVGMSTGELAIQRVNHKKANGFELMGNYAPRYGNAIQHVQWYPLDNGLFTSSEQNSNLSIWDANTFRIVETFNLTREIRYHSMSPVASNNSIVAAALASGEVVLCDLRSGSSSHRLLGHTSSVNSLQWDPLAEYNLVSGCSGGIIRIWDTRSSKTCLRMLPYIHKKRKNHEVHLPVTCLLYTPNGTQLICLRSNNKMEVWNTASWTKKVITGYCSHIAGNHGFPMCTSKNTYPDLLYTACQRVIHIYNLNSDKILNSLSGHLGSISGLIYNSRYENLYSYGRDKQLLVWEPLHDVRDRYGSRVTLRDSYWTTSDEDS